MPAAAGTAAALEVLSETEAEATAAAAAVASAQEVAHR